MTPRVPGSSHGIVPAGGAASPPVGLRSLLATCCSAGGLDGDTEEGSGPLRTGGCTCILIPEDERNVNSQNRYMRKLNKVYFSCVASYAICLHAKPLSSGYLDKDVVVRVVMQGTHGASRP